MRQGALTVKNGAITTDGRAIRVGVLFDPEVANPVTVDPESAKLTLESTLSVTSTGDYTVTPFQGAKVTTAANLTAEAAECCAISGNGNASGTGNNNTTITITGGTIASYSDIAIYHPQGGTLTISGGTISGMTALYARAGKITISDGTFYGYGPVKEYNATANGAPALGDAVVIDNHSSYQELEVTITGGNFSAQYGAPIASYSNGNAAYPVRTGFVSNGKFNKAIAGSLCVDGKCCVKTSGSTFYPWTIGTLPAIVDSNVKIDTPEAKDVIGKIIADASASDGAPTSVEVIAGTKSGVALLPTEVANALAIFGSSVTTSETTENNTLKITVSYDFGISEVYQDGNNIVVKAKVQKRNETNNATEATISNGVTLTLVDGNGAPLEGGVKTLTAATQEVAFSIPVEKIAGKTFKVKATK